MDFDQEMGKVVRSLIGKTSPDAPNVTDSETTEEVETTDKDKEEGTNGAPTLVSTVSLSNIFRHPDAHPIALDLLLLKKYELEWMMWEPETVSLRIEKDFNTSLSENNFHKIQAAKTLHVVDTYWERWEIFLWCTMSLNAIAPNFQLTQVPTVAQVLVSVDIANRIRDDVPWATEVKSFIEAVYRNDDIFYPLPPADFAPIDTEDLILDSASIGKAWPAVRASGKAPEGDNVMDEQLRRLLVAYNYLETSRGQLRHQLRLVSHA